MGEWSSRNISYQKPQLQTNTLKEARSLEPEAYRVGSLLQIKVLGFLNLRFSVSRVEAVIAPTYIPVGIVWHRYVNSMA